MKNTLLLAVICIILFSCNNNNSTPSPSSNQNTNTNISNSSGLTNLKVVKSVNMSNSFSLSNGSSNTYYTTKAGEETATLNGKNVYILVMEGGSGSTAAEFWFNAKPSAGNYSVASYINGYSNGFSSGTVGIGVVLPGSNDYFSEGGGSINLSISNGNYVITTSNVIVSNSSGNEQVFTTNASIP